MVRIWVEIKLSGLFILTALAENGLLEFWKRHRRVENISFFAVDYRIQKNREFFKTIFNNLGYLRSVEHKLPGQLETG